MTSGFAAASGGDERRRSLVLDYFGRDARIRVMRPAPIFGAPVFVVDFDRGPRHFRTLGSFGAADQVTEQSSMDLLYPARLVFHYERLMSLALGLCERPCRALLLGVGGAAMWRFARAYLPDCALTLVDSDETVVGLARRWFYFNQRVAIDRAERFLAGTRERFDAILVDVYDAAGPAPADAAFWARCLEALEPGGCLANNWADFGTNPKVKPMAEALAEAAAARGLDCTFVTRRGYRDNLVQFVPPRRGLDLAALNGALECFARERRLPDRGQGILEHCLVTPHFPLA
jgi:predicted O-methyltransferase YrrM